MAALTLGDAQSLVASLVQNLTIACDGADKKFGDWSEQGRVAFPFIFFCVLQVQQK